jgi:hypothetical protein
MVIGIADKRPKPFLLQIMQVINGHTFNVWIPVPEHDNLPNQSMIFYYKKQ